MQNDYNQRQGIEGGRGRGYDREESREQRGWSSRGEPYERRGQGRGSQSYGGYEGGGYEGGGRSGRRSEEGGYGGYEGGGRSFEGRGFESDEREYGGRWEGRMGQRDVERYSPRGEFGRSSELGGSGGSRGSDYDERGYGRDYEYEGRGGYGGQGQGRFRGMGPKGYSRSDDAILEDVSEELSDADVDASEITVQVSEGFVTLTGSVDSRWSKRCAEDVAYQVRGVKDVRNRLDIESREQRAGETGEQRAFAQGGNGQSRRAGLTETQTQQTIP